MNGKADELRARLVAIQEEAIDSMIADVRRITNKQVNGEVDLCANGGGLNVDRADLDDAQRCQVQIVRVNDAGELVFIMDDSPDDDPDNRVWDEEDIRDKLAVDDILMVATVLELIRG